MSRHRYLCYKCCWTRGAACSTSKPPPPPPDPPKVLGPVFLQFEILGERVGAKGAKFFFAFPEGVFFFTLCVYTQNTQNFVENSKMFEKHRKYF